MLIKICSEIDAKKCNFMVPSFVQPFQIYRYGNCSKIVNTSCLANGIDNKCRPRSDCFFRSSLIRVFAVRYFGKHFVSFSPGNQHYS